MVKVSSALAGQIMIMYHHCAVPDPLRAASWPPRLRDGINLDFSENETTSQPCHDS